MDTLKKFFNAIGDYFINTDKILWFLVICCTVISAVLLSSVERAGGLFVRTQIMAACIGIVIAIVIAIAIAIVIGITCMHLHRETKRKIS